MTAYDVRSGAGSSDVCSSDLALPLRRTESGAATGLVETRLTALVDLVGCIVGDAGRQFGDAHAAVDQRLEVALQEIALRRQQVELGRESCRETVCQDT